MGWRLYIPKCTVAVMWDAYERDMRWAFCGSSWSPTQKVTNDIEVTDTNRYDQGWKKIKHPTGLVRESNILPDDFLDLLHIIALFLKSVQRIVWMIGDEATNLCWWWTNCIDCRSFLYRCFLVPIHVSIRDIISAIWNKCHHLLAMFLHPDIH